MNDLQIILLSMLINILVMIIGEFIYNKFKKKRIYTGVSRITAVGEGRSKKTIFAHFPEITNEKELMKKGMEIQKEYTDKELEAMKKLSKGLLEGAERQ